METYIAILRGINVSGQKKILMVDLKNLFEKLGFNNVVTYIQSGNVVFGVDKRTESKILSRKIEEAIKKKYGFEVPIIIRHKKELEMVVSQNPFLQMKDINLEKLHVTFLENNADENYIENIKQYDFGKDQFVVSGKEIYVYCPDGYGNTKLSNTFFESKLKVKATTRNLKTVNALFELSK